MCARARWHRGSKALFTVRRVSTDETERKEGQAGGRRIDRKEKEPTKEDEERIEAMVESFGRRGRLN